MYIRIPVKCHASIVWSRVGFEKCQNCNGSWESKLYESYNLKYGILCSQCVWGWASVEFPNLSLKAG